ncbi:MAG: putative DNA binding domain-containing protein [Clostridiales bacterium]|nr:putative DNA binding domain-containing protein [Clostridiales bacterium]
MNNDLDIILSEGESYTVEFKESPDRELPSEVCAFANASGGKVYIGVHDEGYVVGTDTSNAARSRIQDTINKIEPRLSVSMDVLDNIIVLTVPEGTHKPYSCPAGFYLRSGPNSQKLDRDNIIEFFQNEGRVRYDEIIRDDLPIDERFNEAAYKRYLKTAKISDVLEREAILKNLHCAGSSGGKLCFTNAGALFFRVNDEDIVFRHAGIVCALYKGTDKAYILDAKELNGDIISNVEDAIIFLKKHLRISYKIEKLRRENILELPEDALREAVVNAVCHRNYFEKGARIMVEIFDDRVDIVSPGGLCKGITPENFGTVTITRNSTIASMFFRIDYIEQMGTGIKRMRNATKEADVAEPEFEFTGFFKVTFKRNELDTPIGHQSAAKRPQPVTTGNNQPNPAKSGQIRLHPATPADRKRVVISFLEENGQAKVDDYINIIGLSAGRIRDLLREMVSDGIIEKTGKGRLTHYVLK